MDPIEKLAEALKQDGFRKAEERGESEIQLMYQGAVVFITGGSGFIGKQLTEKLLRACRKLDKIYLLMRDKRKKTIMERLEKLFKGPVYEELRAVFPDFEKKIHPIRGDISKLKLGLSDQDWKTLTNEVNFIFHAAATVKFDEPLKAAIIANVRGTREILLLARECKNLKSFVYISTAYSHCYLEAIEEVFYRSPVPPETIIDFVQSVDVGVLDAITPELVSSFPNIYTFSKAVAEEAVRVYGEGLPTCITRPAIVTAAYREPSLGWLDTSNIFGPSGVILGPIMGIIRILLVDLNSVADLVPVDFTNNLAIAASWDTAKRHQDGDRNAKIYTLSRFRNRLTFGEVKNFADKNLRPLVSPRAVWYAIGLTTKNRCWFFILTWLLHFIPALLIDFVLIIAGKEFRLMKAYRKIYKLSTVLSYFMLGTWDLHDKNTVDLISKMTESDKDIFCFDMETIQDNKNYLYAWYIGMRRFIVKDDLKGTVTARKRQIYLKIATVFLAILYFYVILKIGCLIFFCVKWFFASVNKFVC